MRSLFYCVAFLFSDRVHTRDVNAGAVRSFHITGIENGNLVSDFQAVRKIREICIGADGEGDGTIVCLEDKGIHRRVLNRSLHNVLDGGGVGRGDRLLGGNGFGGF